MGLTRRTFLTIIAVVTLIVFAQNIILLGHISSDASTSTNPKPSNIETLRGQFASLFEDVQHSWNDYGKHDPYWGVLTNDQYHLSNISANVREQFFLTGRDTIEHQVIPYLKQHNIILHGDNALDFGCGVCRISVQLARFFNTVYSVDISEHYLKECMKNAKHFKLNNIIPILNKGTIDLNGDTVDFIISLISIQHNPSEIQRLIIKQLLGLLNPNGVAYLHIPYGRNITSKKEEILALEEKERMIKRAKTEIVMQVHYTPRVVIEQIIQDQNCELVGFFATSKLGGNWLDAIFIIRKLNY
eukprot:93071_1